jgi:hypothetical protein
MPIQTLAHSPNAFNQSFPIWDYGAWIYWNSRRGRVAPTGSTPYRHGDGFLSHNPASSGADNLIYDPARGVFREYSNVGSAEFPPSGICTDGATNRWLAGNNTAASRGFSTDAGLAATTPSTTENREIVELLGGGPVDALRVNNFAGVPQNAFATFDISSAGDYTFAVLVRRNDRGTVDSSTCSLQVVDGGSVDITNTSTRYIKVGGKGWYLLYVHVTVGASTVITWRVNVAVGITNLRIELPCVQDGSVFAGELGAWTPIRTDGVTPPFRSEHEISIENAEFTITSGGWIGCTFVPVFPSLGDAASPTSVTYETSVLLNLRATGSATERIRFIISSSAQMFRFDYDAAGAGAGTSLTPASSFFKQGVPVGMVVTWGYRSGSLTYTLFVNGQQVGIHSTAPIGIPDSANTGELLIAHQNSANACNVSLQQVAAGNKRLPRIAGRNLSRWFERQARFVVGEFGA